MLDRRGTWRPKEGTGSRQAGVTDCGKKLDVGAKNQLGPPVRTESLLNRRAISPVPIRSPLGCLSEMRNYNFMM